MTMTSRRHPGTTSGVAGRCRSDRVPADRRLRGSTFAVMVAGVALSACDSGADAAVDAGERLNVVATIAPAGALAAAVAGTSADVSVLAGPGTDPHDFELSPGARQELAKDLQALALTEDAVPGERTRHGQKFEVRGRLRGTSGRGALVVTVWIVPAVGEPPRLVTAYPGAES